MLLTFPYNCLVQREANLWIMNTDLPGSVPALLPTGRPWRHVRQRPSADCSLISRRHSAVLHLCSSKTLRRLIPDSREDRQTTIMLMNGLWVNCATLRNGSPTDNCTWPLPCDDKWRNYHDIYFLNQCSVCIIIIAKGRPKVDRKHLLESLGVWKIMALSLWQAASLLRQAPPKWHSSMLHSDFQN